MLVHVFYNRKRSFLPYQKGDEVDHVIDLEFPSEEANNADALCDKIFAMMNRGSGREIVELDE